MSIELAVNDLVGRGGDGFASRASIRPSSRLVRAAAFLTSAIAPDQGLRHGFLADPEILARPLGLGAPIAVMRPLSIGPRESVSMRVEVLDFSPRS